MGYHMGRHPVAHPPTQQYIEDKEADGININLNADEPDMEAIDPPYDVDTFTWTEDTRHIVAEAWSRNGDAPDRAPKKKRVTEIKLGEHVRVQGSDFDWSTRLIVESYDTGFKHNVEGRTVRSCSELAVPHHGVIVAPRDHLSAIHTVLHSDITTAKRTP